MKEGYLQKKIAEFSERLQDFNHRLNMAETEFDRYQTDLGNFKDLLKKLKNVEEFQQKGIEKFEYETKEILSQQVSSLKETAEKKVERAIEQKSELMTQSLDRIKQDEQQFKTSLEEIEGLREEVLYYKEFQRLFILKLINKGILNHRELSEIELRSKKRVKKKDEK